MINLTTQTPLREEIDLNAKQLSEITHELIIGCHEKEERIAKKYGLTQTEYKCLRLMSKGKISQNKQIHALMSVSPSRLTRIVDELCGKELVKREIDVRDRRNMLLSLTEKGNLLMEKINNDFINAHIRILNAIQPQMRNTLIEFTRKYVNELKKWVE